MVKCANCGAEYPDDIRKRWGKDIGDGYGPRPVCINLVPVDGAPPPIDPVTKKIATTIKRDSETGAAVLDEKTRRPVEEEQVPHGACLGTLIFS